MWDSFLRWFDSTTFWRFISSRIIAHFTFRWWRYNEFDWSRYEELDTILKNRDPGYVYAFVTCDTLSLAGLLIRKLAGTTWSHAGVFADDNYNTILEMKGKGLLVHNLLFPLSQTDNFAVVRYYVGAAGYAIFQRRVAEAIKKQKDFRYDFEQELKNDELQLYCSELIHYFLKDLVKMKEPDYILGRFAFSPDSVYLSGEILFEHYVR